MVNIKCEVFEDSEMNDYETDSPCIRAVCSKCGHETMSYGTSEESVRHCLVLMREECPLGENNFYVEDEAGYR